MYSPHTQIFIICIPSLLTSSSCYGYQTHDVAIWADFAFCIACVRSHALIRVAMEQLRANVQAINRFIGLANSGSAETAQCEALCSMIAGHRQSMTYEDQAALMELIAQGNWGDAARRQLTDALVSGVTTIPIPSNHSMAHGGERQTQTCLHFHYYPTKGWWDKFMALPSLQEKTTVLMRTAHTMGLTNPSEKTAQALAAYAYYVDKGFAGTMDVDVKIRLKDLQKFKDALKNMAKVSVVPPLYVKFPTSGEVGVQLTLSPHPGPSTNDIAAAPRK